MAAAAAGAAAVGAAAGAPKVGATAVVAPNAWVVEVAGAAAPKAGVAVANPAKYRQNNLRIFPGEFAHNKY